MVEQRRTQPRGADDVCRHRERARGAGSPRLHDVTGAGHDPLALRIILDGSILEVVAADRVTATVRLPAIGAGPRDLSVTTFGGTCRVVDAEIIAINERLIGPAAHRAVAPGAALAPDSLATRAT